MSLLLVSLPSDMTLKKSTSTCRPLPLLMNYAPRFVPAGIRSRTGFYRCSVWLNLNGLLFALPGWAGSEHVACFDLTEVDGRLYADNVPVAATKDVLLRLAALPPDSAVDIYVGSSVAPIGPDEVAELNSLVCLFFIHNFELPGPYFCRRNSCAHRCCCPCLWPASWGPYTSTVQATPQGCLAGGQALSWGLYCFRA